MMALEHVPTCADCGIDVTPDNEGACVHDWRCESCWERCDRAACRDGCHESGGAA